MTSIALGLVLLVFNAFMARLAIEFQHRISSSTYSPRDEQTLRWMLVVGGSLFIALGAAEVWLSTFHHPMNTPGHSISANQSILWWGMALKAAGPIGLAILLFLTRTRAVEMAAALNPKILGRRFTTQTYSAVLIAFVLMLLSIGTKIVVTGPG
ncbi:MAG: hypothetical protein WBY93_21285 [Candidatus Binatus sp.]